MNLYQGDENKQKEIKSSLKDEWEVMLHAEHEDCKPLNEKVYEYALNFLSQLIDKLDDTDLFLDNIIFDVTKNGGVKVSWIFSDEAFFTGLIFSAGKRKLQLIVKGKKSKTSKEKMVFNKLEATLRTYKII